ncbi:hypothetical protein [Planococcus sp. S3-L1]|uniref:hypothetical protein n=1 Tax=Planococcus sp. S3-L1 TaxID=3046200 RepID=UPI0024BB275C|nr:hypothetical protein [Planococcus sp. S3-L1]MDJ0332230.1 hypothetical protein [Planococcus sp. S3-L1]
MSRFENELKKEVNNFLEKNIRFSHREGEQLRSRINQPKKRFVKANPVYLTILVAAASLLILLSYTFVEDNNSNIFTGSETSKESIGINQQNQNETLYKGKELVIAALGDAPEVEEKQITFQEINFEEFTVKKIRNFDAVFIMNESLSVAAEKRYTHIFTESNIPFFFIDSNKGAYPFIDENLEYNEAREIPYHDYYATGYLLTIEGEEITWTYESSEKNNQDAFSTIFQTIENALPKTFHTGVLNK